MKRMKGEGELKSKDYVKEALNHKETDRVPMDFGGFNCTTMHVGVITKLREYLGLDRHPVKVTDLVTMTGEIEDDLRDILGIDTCDVLGNASVFGIAADKYKEWAMTDGTVCLVPEDFNVTDDGNGGFFAYPKGDISMPPSAHMPAKSYYFDIISRQKECDFEDLQLEDNLREFVLWPEDKRVHFEKEAKKKRESGRYVIISDLGTSLGGYIAMMAPFDAYPKGIRSIEDWMMATAVRPDFIREIFEYETDIAIENLKSLSQETLENVDAAFICGLDFGGQLAPIYSLETIKKVYAPYYKKVNDWIHANTEWKTIKHSCGANWDVIPILIEAGFDALNPVQCSAVGMDPLELKREYGSDITFWGGGVDTQKTLPFGTSQQVYDQVCSRLEIFSKGGGYVFNSIHCIQMGVPMENLIAMFNAYYAFNGMSKRL